MAYMPDAGNDSWKSLRVTSDLKGKHAVKLAPGIVVFSPWQLTLTTDDYVAALEIVATPMKGTEVGRFVCESVTMRRLSGKAAPSVTSEMLRSLPVARLIRGLASQEVALGDDGKQRLDDADVARITESRLRRETPSDETLKWVAHAYRLALVLGEPPTKAVRSTLGLPPSTAAHWVALARERGQLGPSEGQGKGAG